MTSAVTQQEKMHLQKMVSTAEVFGDHDMSLMILKLA